MAIRFFRISNELFGALNKRQAGWRSRRDTSAEMVCDVSFFYQKTPQKRHGETSGLEKINRHTGDKREVVWEEKLIFTLKILLFFAIKSVVRTCNG